MNEICIPPWKTEVFSTLERQMKMQSPYVAEADKDKNELKQQH